MEHDYSILFNNKDNNSHATTLHHSIIFYNLLLFFRDPKWQKLHTARLIHFIVYCFGKLSNRRTDIEANGKKKNLFIDPLAINCNLLYYKVSPNPNSKKISLNI